VVFLFPRQQFSNPNEETKMSKRFTLKTLAAVGAMALGTLLVSTGAMAQQKLKWAHVYETSEPYHTESVWAAEEI
jgi:TRAP-type C4-dicarboxylate transport system substrate-binding protein